MEPDRIEQDTDTGEWVRHTDDQDLRGVGALRVTSDPEQWQVSVWVAEFLREEPLEGELRSGVDGALRAVPGVLDVVEEDREVWLVSGNPSGQELVRAVGVVVDLLAPRAGAHIDEMM